MPHRLDRSQFDSVIQSLQAQQPSPQVAVISHLRPDGDAIGAQIALTRYLRSKNIAAFVVLEDLIPKNLQSFIADTPTIPAEKLTSDFRAIYVDCADIKRPGPRLATLFPNPILNVDHHISNTNFAQNNVVQPHFAATAHVLAKLFLEENVAIDPITAEALYLGIMTDSGQFAYSATTANLLRIAADLVDRGANPSSIPSRLYDETSFPRIQLLLRFLQSFELELVGKVCIGIIDKGAFDQTGSSKEDTEGFVEYARAIEGVKIGVLLEELPNLIKGSFRAKKEAQRVDILARNFGGGGHAAASGFSFNGNLETFYPLLIKTLEDHLTKYP